MFLLKSYKLRDFVNKLNKERGYSLNDYKIPLEKTIEILSNEDKEHLINVSVLAYRFAKILKLDYLSMMRYGFYHDIGKINLMKYISLHRKLKEEEFEKIKGHALIGANILLNCGKIEDARIVLLHHESYDGSGYLLGLEGKEIPLEARVMKIVDVYEALRGKRPYKKPFSIEKSLDIMLGGDERTKPEHFDRKLLYIFADNADYIDLNTNNENFGKYLERTNKNFYDIN